MNKRKREKTMKIVRLEGKKGITLIALVVTIIVLIILAGISIGALSGEDGIINNAKVARDKTNRAKEEEQIDIAILKAEQINEDATMNDVIEELKKDGIITEDTQIGEDGTITSNSGEVFKEKLKDYIGKIETGKEGLIIDKSGANKPDVQNGMTLKKFDEDGNPEDIDPEEDGYDYSTNRWANAQTEDGSFWVWIPRFEYKITPPEEGEEAGKIDVKFISVDKMTPTEGYTIHPAFTNDIDNGGWSSNITGFWIAKYEMSMEENGEAKETIDTSVGNVAISDTIKMVSKPGVKSWNNINIANCYTNSYNYDRNKESHMIKNSEYGAVVYLSHSQYGRNGKEISANTTYFTGGIQGATAITNVTQSSTGNETGVFDLNGGHGEYIAAYNNVGENIGECIKYKDVNGEHFASIGGKSTKYATAYANNSDSFIPTAENSKVGDATFEVYLGNECGWFGVRMGQYNSQNAIKLRSSCPAYFTDINDGQFSFVGSYGAGGLAHTFRVILIHI